MTNPAYTLAPATVSRTENYHGTDEYFIGVKSLQNNPMCTYIVFLVEQTFFTLPRHCFEQGSELFRDLFTLPRTQGGPPEGSSKERPLRLDGISKADFIPFIKILCQEVCEALTWLAWLSVFKLANMWDFETVRRKALREMTLMRVSPVERIVAARKYDIQEWYWPALLQLSEMQNCLDIQDTQRLGIDFTLRVSQFQGFRRGLQASNYRYKHTSPMYLKLTDQHFTDFFPRELKGIPLSQCSEEVQVLCEKIRAPVIKTAGLGGTTSPSSHDGSNSKNGRKFVIMR